MEILLTIIHLVACFLLIVIVLLQKGKGADLAGAFGGGGSQASVGVRTSTQIIHKLTIAAAVFFMITSYSLGLLQGAGKSYGEMLEQRQSAQPAAEEGNGEAESGDDAVTDETEEDIPEQTPEPSENETGISSATEENKENPDGGSEPNG